MTSYDWTDATRPPFARPWPRSGETGPRSWLAARAQGRRSHPGWAYVISVEQIRTWPAYLHWCAHLMGKPWLKATDWQYFVLNSLGPFPAAISGLRPIRPQNLGWHGVGD